MIDYPLTYIEIDLDAIAHNIRNIKRHIGPNVLLYAVVKANAYGHGAVPVARAALRYGADRLAVARAAEGVVLRDGGISAPILIMNYAGPAEIAAAVEHDLTLTVTEWHTAERLAALAELRGTTARIHLKIDTGMGRFGLLPEDVPAFVQHLARLPALTIEGIFSHFAVADFADKSYTWQQFHTFERVLDTLAAAGHTFPVRHIANSAAALDLPTMHLDAVRIGIAMYGLHPSDAIAPAVPLVPALTFKSRVARVGTLPQGASISYGRTYITPRAMPVALVPVGYGDGYHRLHSNRGAVLINGQRAPIVGRVCMDQFVVDVSQVGPVRVDDEIVLIGAQGDARLTAEEVARWAETINYEVTTSLLPRLPRLYQQNGSIVTS